MGESTEELSERLARLEAEVARLAVLLEARKVPRPEQPPPPPPPPPRPKPPDRKVSPVVLVAAAGAAIFLAGAAFFLHLAIQQGWIGPEMRFILGLLAGGGLAFYAGRLFFRNAEAVGTCLLGAGLGTLLFTLYAGAFRSHFYAPPVGFAAAAMTTLVAGALAARVRSQAALCVALAVGLATPLLFSEGGHHEIALALYLAALLAGAITVPYATRTGAQWTLARWLGLGGVWALLALAAPGLRAPDGPGFLALLALHYALAAVWVWLPRQGQPEPAASGRLWTLATLAMTTLLWVSWRNAGLGRESFALPVLAVALANLLLVRPLRARLDSRRADLGLLVLVGIHLALAVPVALAWHWVGSVWGLAAAGLAWAAEMALARHRGEEKEARALTLSATGLSVLATLAWVFDLGSGFGFGPVLGPPFLNTRFAEGALAAAAWGLLARRGGNLGTAGFVGLEAMGNVVLTLELGRLVRFAGAGALAQEITHTLVLAASGCGQWLLSLRQADPRTARALGWAGYLWLVAASAKLILVDLDQASLPLRAVVFLGVGALFLAAAVAARRLRGAGAEG